MKRQTGLSGIQGIREVADALLPGQKPLDDPEPGLVRKGVKQTAQALSAGRSVKGGKQHEVQYINES